MRDDNKLFYVDERRFEFVEIYDSFKTKEIGTWTRIPNTDELLIRLPILYTIDFKYEYIELFTFKYNSARQFEWVNTFHIKEEKSNEILKKLSETVITVEKDIFTEMRVKIDLLRKAFSA